MPYMVIISDDMGRVSIHEDLDQEGVENLVTSSSISAEDSVEIFEYVREIPLSSFLKKPLLADQEISPDRFKPQPVGRCKTCQEDVYANGKECNCKNCGPRKRDDMDIYYYPS